MSPVSEYDFVSKLEACLEPTNMDDYMFKSHVQNCKNVVESTSYLEILNYSDPSYNCVEEHPLTDDEFENFLNRRVRRLDLRPRWTTS